MSYESEKRYSEEHIVSALRRLDDAFNRRTSPNTLKIYKEKISRWNISAEILEHAVERAIETQKSFPTLSTLRDLLPPMQVNDNKNEFGFTPREWLMYESEQKEYRKRKAEFIKDSGIEKLGFLVRAWCKARMPKAYEELYKYGLTFDQFEQCALEDFYKANFKWDRFIKLASSN